jgi:nitroreductase
MWLAHFRQLPEHKLRMQAFAFIFLSVQTDPHWVAVRAVIDDRRAVRDFEPCPVDDEDLRDILEAALLAPSSSNLQLFRLHVVTSPEKRSAVAAACMNQRAARGAPVLVAVAACPREALPSLREQLSALDADARITARARKHAAAHLARMNGVVRWTASTAAMPWVRLALWCLRWVRPVPDLAAGERAFCAWAVRNSAFVAQTLMLAAQARGYASCPMEGFDRFRVQRALGLKDEHVWLIIAIGRRAADARVEPRWRRSFETLVRMH